MSRITLLSFIALSGCATSPESDSAESAITVGPYEGVWMYQETGPVDSTCKDAPVQAEAPGPFTIDTVTDTSFHVVPSDGTPSFTCLYSDGRFDCPNRGTATFDLRPTTDAVIAVQAFATGLFVDGQHALGKQDGLVTCTGSQCIEVLGDTQCGLVVNFELVMP